MNYDSGLKDLGYWYQQLGAESLGKKGKWINPILSFGPKDHHSLLQLYLDGPKDKFFTFFNSSQKEDKFKVSQDIIPNNMRFLKNKNEFHKTVLTDWFIILRWFVITKISFDVLIQK